MDIPPVASPTPGPSLKVVFRVSVSVLLMFFSSVGCHAASKEGKQNALAATWEGTEPVSSRYFGLHIKWRSPESSWPSVRVGSWRLWTSWPQIEGQKGQFDFSKVDEYLRAAEQHDAQVVITLGYTPRWASSKPNQRCLAGPGGCAAPRNLEDWRIYVRRVAERYKGRIFYYEVWNEASYEGFYKGSVPQIVELARLAYETLKQVDPRIQVLSPSATGASGLQWFRKYLEAGGGNYADAISYHFYVFPLPPEPMYPLVQQVRNEMARYGVATKPLWDTEFGWIDVTLSERDQAAYAVRALLLDRAAGVDRAFFYEWGTRAPQTLFMTEEDGKTPTLAGRAYSVAQDWMTGSIVKRCLSMDVPPVSRASHALWTCELQRNRRPAWIVWNPDGVSTYKIPPEYLVEQVQGIDATIYALPKSREILISPAPVLLSPHGWIGASARN